MLTSKDLTKGAIATTLAALIMLSYLMILACAYTHVTSATPTEAIRPTVKPCASMHNYQTPTAQHFAIKLFILESPNWRDLLVFHRYCFAF